MSEIKKIDFSLKKKTDSSLISNTKEDVKTLAKSVNILIKKINELIDSNNKLLLEQNWLQEQLKTKKDA